MAEPFAEFFTRVTGYRPYGYQERLAQSAELPELLAVPTGAGKTAAVIVGWMWRRRAGEEEIRSRTPRRLIFCLPMRTIVEQVARDATAWAQNAGGEPPIRVHVLMGGAVDIEWDDAPDADAILVGTQDQLLSRALNRGFAMSRFRWPVHFAFVNDDVLWVFDEVQLMGPALSTSAQLQAFREQFGTFFPARSLWMSATLNEQQLATIDFGRRPPSRIEIDDADRAAPAEDATRPSLARRLGARKIVRRARTAWQADVGRYAAELAREILDVHVDGSRTIVVLNRVARAQAVFERLQRARSTVPVALVHSRFRPPERRAVQERALARDWTGIVVTTQALEAGVDVSCRTLVSELASAAALIQRFGRCNREGEWAGGDASVLWVDLPGGDESVARPYTAGELSIARAWLSTLEDVGPHSLAAAPRGRDEPALPVIRRRDLLDLFDTQADLSGCDIDVSPYVRDVSEAQVQVAWRTWEGDTPPADAPFPAREELCAVPIGEIRAFLERQDAWRWDSLRGEWAKTTNPIPGMVLLIRSDAGGYDPERGWTGRRADGPVAPVPLAHPTPPEADSDDPLAAGDGFVALTDHADAVVDALDALCERLGGAGQFADPVILRRAARWHDAGKVHHAFQAMLVARLPDDDPRRSLGPWAKSNSRARCERRHFRHELASALALLAHGGGDLEAYIVAAHHGKVRMGVRSRPGENAGDAEPTILGLRAGDVLPMTELGGGEVMDAVTLDLDLLALGEGEHGPSWRARTSALLERYGPFRLAYLEALLRVADWNGSRRNAASSAEVLSHE
jgi:CRISPR-associated endonuclease/helicase Cas3